MCDMLFSVLSSGNGMNLSLHLVKASQQKQFVDLSVDSSSSFFLFLINFHFKSDGGWKMDLGLMRKIRFNV